jgi:hypothetical protein
MDLGRSALAGEPLRISAAGVDLFPEYFRQIGVIHVGIARHSGRCPSVRPYPFLRRVAISDFTHDTARRIGPTAQGGLCHEASIPPAAQSNRSSLPDPRPSW